jgi:L-malate glycosyltransferase
MVRSSLKIALVSSQPNWGGGEQILHSLGTSLQQSGHAVFWVVPHESPLAKKLEASQADTFLVRGRHPGPATTLRLRRELSHRGIDIVFGNDSHAITWAGMAALRWKSRRRKIIGIKHTVFPIRSASRYNWLLDRMVCVSHAVRRVCIDSGILDSKLSVVHGGLDIENLDRANARAEANSRLQIDSTIPLIAAVGSLIPCKGHEKLIAAASLLKRSVGDFRLVVCGEGSSRKHLEEQIQSQGLQDQVKLLGFCQNPDQWIAAADLFVHPSQSEGLSLVTIAAQMLGTPVVATDVGGLSEVMKCRYTSRPLGWILATREPQELAELILDGLENQSKRRRIIEDAQQSAFDQFSVARMTAGFLRVFEQALSDQGELNSQSRVLAFDRAA